MKIIKTYLPILLLFICLFCWTQNSNAQQKPFKFGFKLSPAISWLSPDAKDYDQGGSAFTFAWGFVSDITLMDHYYISTGFNVSYFKGKLSYPNQFINDEDGLMVPYDGTLDRTYNLRYIEVPLALKMKTNELVDNFQFFGLIGLNTGFNIRAKANDHFSGTYEALGTNLKYNEEKVDIKKETAAAKASLIVGAGTEYVIDDSVSLIFGINFNNGFTNVLKGSNSLTAEDARAIPYYFELNFGVIF